MRSFYRKRKIIFILLIVVGVLSLSSITYAIFTVTTSQSGTNEINTMKCLELTFSNQENNINLVNTYPMTDERGAKNTPYTFTITNNCGAYIEYSVGLMIDDANTLEDKYVKTMFSLKDDVGDAILLTDREEGKTYNDNKTYLFRRDGLTNGESKDYKLRLWVDYDATSGVANKSFNSQIIINAYPQNENNKITVTLDLAGGENKQELNDFYFTGDKITLLNPTLEGVTFIGWEVVSGDATLEDNVLTIKKQNCVVKAKWQLAISEFTYTGYEQSYVVPVNGLYKLEIWGAQGGYAKNIINGYGGYGSYSVGTIALTLGDEIYINVGGAGCNATTKTMDCAGGYNGGGSTVHWKDGSTYNGSGGGATHIAKNSGLLETMSSNISSIIIVAGGGGGSAADDTTSQYILGANAGGYIGSDGNPPPNNDGSYGLGGTQSAGGSYVFLKRTAPETGGFGKGGNSASVGGAGGGGGYYGGGGAGVWGTGGGGSGYIGNTLLTTKAMYCYNCATSDEENTKTISTTCAEETPTANCSKKGNGYAIITFIS